MAVTERMCCADLGAGPLDVSSPSLDACCPPWNNASDEETILWNTDIFAPSQRGSRRMGPTKSGRSKLALTTVTETLSQPKSHQLPPSPLRTSKHDVEMDGSRRLTVTVETWQSLRADGPPSYSSLDMTEHCSNSGLDTRFSPARPRSDDSRCSLSTTRTLVVSSGDEQHHASTIDVTGPPPLVRFPTMPTASPKQRRGSIFRRSRTDDVPMRLADSLQARLTSELDAQEQEDLGLESQLLDDDEGQGAPFEHQYRRPSILAWKRGPQKEPSLAKKAACYRNSRLPDSLPAFNTKLSTWALVSRALQASIDAYRPNPEKRAAGSLYTAASKSSEGAKAMIMEDHLVDDRRVIIVAIRGTNPTSLTDWAVNAGIKPAPPRGFLDDQDNAIHAGFLAVARAMVNLIASQLRRHPATASTPSLLFTGHSAGGAVAALLYKHMFSQTVKSELTALAPLFAQAHCITFGAPQVSIRPIAAPTDGGSFVAFANEGDPLVLIGNIAYLKCLAKLAASSAPTQATPDNISETSTRRGGLRRYVPTSIKRRGAPARSPSPAADVDDLPTWPCPPIPFAHAGELVLLCDRNKKAAAMSVGAADLDGVFFGDFSQHSVYAYMRRVDELACSAMLGRRA